VKTTKVRIALEIAPNGEWQAYGSSHIDLAEDGGDTWGLVMDGLEALDGHHVKRHWITAEIPVPAEDAEVVAGSAVEETAAPAASEAA
jgi:hypothetical protein